MKAHRIELKNVPSTNELTGEASAIDYSALLRLAVISGGERGMSADDVIKGADLAEEIKKADGALLLSPEDHQWIVRRVNAMSWQRASTELAAFIREVRAAPLTDVVDRAAAK